MIRRGDILLLSFPFTNLQSEKVRPALVVSCDSLNETGQDAIFVFITRREYRSPYDMRLEDNHPAFKSTGLKTSSTFRISKLMCLEQKLAKRKLGYADTKILGKIDAVLKNLFDLRGKGEI